MHGLSPFCCPACCIPEHDAHFTAPCPLLPCSAPSCASRPGGGRAWPDRPKAQPHSVRWEGSSVRGGPQKRGAAHAAGPRWWLRGASDTHRRCRAPSDRAQDGQLGGTPAEPGAAGVRRARRLHGCAPRWWLSGCLTPGVRTNERVDGWLLTRAARCMQDSATTHQPTNPATHAPTHPPTYQPASQLTNQQACTCTGCSRRCRGA